MLPSEYSKPAALWARPHPTAGDEDQWRIFARVGATLSEWESLEGSMGDLFAIVVESESAAALRAYGTIVSSHGRRDAIYYAGLIYFQDRTDSEDYADFTSILANYSEAAGRRNDVAHGMAARIEDASGKPMGFWLFPSLHATKKGRLALAIKEAREHGKVPSDPMASVSYLYSSDGIETIRSKLVAFHREVRSYIQRIAPEFSSVVRVKFGQQPLP